jgi:hypothetical protein
LASRQIPHVKVPVLAYAGEIPKGDAWSTLTNPTKTAVPPDWGFEAVLQGSKKYVSKSPAGRRISLGAAQAMLWCWKRKELNLAHLTEQSCALTPQTLIKQDCHDQHYFVLASTCHGAWVWEAELLESNLHGLRFHGDWEWLTVTNVKAWQSVPYEWCVNSSDTENFGFLALNTAATPVPLVIEALCRKRRPLVHQRMLLLRCYGLEARSGAFVPRSM